MTPRPYKYTLNERKRLKMPLFCFYILYLNNLNMNLIDLYMLIENLAMQKVQVNSFHNEDPYNCLNVKEVKYGAVCFAVQSVEDTSNTRKYRGLMYYADRLVEGGSNWMTVQDDGINVLSSIVNDLKEADGVYDVELNITYTVFKQKFADYLAGAYCDITIETPNDNCKDYE